MTYAEPRTVYNYKHCGNRWVKVRSFGVDWGGWITLSVKNNQIKCCSTRENKIVVYAPNGELLQAYGTRGSGDASLLNFPYVSAGDASVNLLIADRNNDRLQVMSEQGEFSVLQLQPPVSRPTSAVIFKNQLYVTSETNKALVRFV